MDLQQLALNIPVLAVGSCKSFTVLSFQRNMAPWHPLQTQLLPALMVRSRHLTSPEITSLTLAMKIHRLDSRNADLFLFCKKSCFCTYQRRLHLSTLNSFFSLTSNRMPCSFHLTFPFNKTKISLLA